MKTTFITRADYLERLFHESIDRFDAVILANGEYPKHSILSSVMQIYRDRIFCCDGAADSLPKHRYTPVAVVGDCDSISEEVRERLKDRLVVVGEQESNDLTKTVRHCILHGYNRLCILGATGKREDHTLGNISLLADYMGLVIVEMWTNYGIFTPAHGNTVLKTFKGQDISIFCLDDKPLTSTGLKWSLNNQIITRWWQASLNRATGNLVSLITEGQTITFCGYGD
jgi:thiamine pyrophosphokinase